MARVVRDIGTESWIATSAYLCGDLIQAQSGRIGVVTNMAPVTVGELVCVQTDVEVEAESGGVAFAAGAVVGWNATTKRPVAAGAGDFDAGRAAVAATTTQTVRILLNR